MSDDDIPKLVPEGNLSYYSNQLASLESEIAGIALEIEFSSTLTEISAHPCWKKITDRLRTAETNMLGKLRDTEMTPYYLGKTQGTLKGLAMLLRDQPLSGADLDSRRERITFLRNQIDEIRHLLN